eukprot:scaffold41448_cov67-Phaeocystis_antarctica.AAC.2
MLISLWPAKYVCILSSYEYYSPRRSDRLPAPPAATARLAPSCIHLGVTAAALAAARRRPRGLLIPLALRLYDLLLRTLLGVNLLDQRAQRDTAAVKVGTHATVVVPLHHRGPIIGRDARRLWVGGVVA